MRKPWMSIANDMLSDRLGHELGDILFDIALGANNTGTSEVSRMVQQILNDHAHTFHGVRGMDDIDWSGITWLDKDTSRDLVVPGRQVRMTGQGVPHVLDFGWIEPGDAPPIGLDIEANNAELERILGDD